MKSSNNAIELQCFNKDVLLEWSSLFRNSRSTGCDSNFIRIFFNILYMHFSSMPTKRVHQSLISWWFLNSHWNRKNIMIGIIYESSQFNENSHNTKSFFYQNSYKFVI